MRKHLEILLRTRLAGLVSVGWTGVHKRW